MSTVPFRDVELTSVEKHFDATYYKTFVELLFCDSSEYEAALIKADSQRLLRLYKRFVLNCVFLVEKGGVADDSVMAEGARHCYRVFQGKLPWSPRVAWIEDNKPLKDLLVKSYRYFTVITLTL